MNIERAIEILDPEHYEQYDSIETVKEACRMGMQALEKQIPKKCTEKTFDDEEEETGKKFKWKFLLCPVCGEHIALREYRFCPCCGQALDRSDEK